MFVTPPAGAKSDEEVTGPSYTAHSCTKTFRGMLNNLPEQSVIPVSDLVQPTAAWTRGLVVRLRADRPRLRQEPRVARLQAGIPAGKPVEVSAVAFVAARRTCVIT